MPIEQIVSLLVAERDRLNLAIEALQGSARRRAAAASTGAPARARKRKPMSAAKKKAQSERMKAFWEARRKAKKG